MPDQDIVSISSVFPAELKIDVLEKTNSKYDPTRFAENLALYEGDLNKALKNKFLYLREIERDDVNIGIASKGSKLREARLQHATYSNPIAPPVDYCLAAAFQSPPQVIFSLLEDSPADSAMNAANVELSAIQDNEAHNAAEVQHLEHIKSIDRDYQLQVDEKLKYYNELSKCIPELLMDCFLDVVLHGCSNISACFPESKSANFHDQLINKELDARLYRICPDEIIDWDIVDGRVNMLKLYQLDYVRKNVYEVPNIERHTWTFITESETVVYVGEREIGKPWPKGVDTPIKGVSKLNPAVDGPDGKVSQLPVFEIYLSKKKCLVSRIKQLVIDHFNTEADLSFSLHCNSHPHLFFKLNPTHKINEVVNSPMTAWILQAGTQTSNAEDVGYAGTSGVEFESQNKQVSRLERLISDRLNAAALSIATRDTQGRASANAKWRDLSPINILLSTYTDKLKEAITKAIEYIIKIRKDDKLVTFKLIGMDKFDVEGLKKRMEEFGMWYKYPGSKTARKFVASQLDQSMIVGASQEIRKQVDVENESLEIEADEEVDEIENEEELEESPVDNDNDDVVE